MTPVEYKKHIHVYIMYIGLIIVLLIDYNIIVIY